MWGLVPALVGRRATEAEVSPQVDHLHPITQLRNQGHRHAVGQGEEDDVRIRRHGRLVQRLGAAVDEPADVGKDLGEGFAGPGVGDEMPQVRLRVSQEQTDDLPAPVAGRADHTDVEHTLPPPTAAGG